MVMVKRRQRVASINLIGASMAMNGNIGKIKNYKKTGKKRKGNVIIQGEKKEEDMYVPTYPEIPENSFMTGGTTVRNVNLLITSRNCATRHRILAFLF